LIGVVVAYAVAAQSLLIVLGGFAPAARAEIGPAAFELCLHGRATTDQPPGVPAQPGCIHCIFCFAGAHHAVIGQAPLLFHRIDVEIPTLAWAAATSIAPRVSAHSIASPRGPPQRA
jgi:hypothetical protein